jgi:hypothetical protein
VAFGYSRALRVDEVGVLGVVLDEGAYDRAHDGDRFALRARGSVGIVDYLVDKDDLVLTEGAVPVGYPASPAYSKA